MPPRDPVSTHVPPSPSQPQPGLFLDRDGTIIVHRPYLFKPDEVELLPGAREALIRARDAGFLIFLFTNQSGVGRGYFSMDDVHAVHARVVELLGLGSSVFADICIAPERPDQPSAYRKPSPRFIEECVARWSLDPRRCWMIGDSPSDWEAGLNARISALAVPSDQAAAEHEAARQRWHVPLFPSLLAAVDSILRDTGESREHS
jgi:D-glycero-D-manno-heptose 1,7-bisphosphate phosphatase